MYDNQQEAEENLTMNVDSSTADNTDETSNPLGNTTEEKNPNSSNSFSEEFLHDQHTHDYWISVSFQFRKCENVDTYLAYHGELLVPPPDRF